MVINYNWGKIFKKNLDGHQEQIMSDFKWVYSRKMLKKRWSAP